jgi:hypothetical protein
VIVNPGWYDALRVGGNRLHRFQGFALIVRATTKDN